MQESSRSQAFSASRRIWSKPLFPASASRFLRAPVVPVADRPTFTVISGVAAVSKRNQAASFRPAISGKLWYWGNLA